MKVLLVGPDLAVVQAGAASLTVSHPNATE